MDPASSTFPESSYGVIIVWAFVIFGLWYWFRHAEKRPRYGFVRTATLVSAPFLLIFISIWYFQLPTLKLTRVLVFPFLKHSERGEVLSWESLAIAETMIGSFNDLDREGLLAFDLEAVMDIVSLDSLSDQTYLLELSRRAKADFALVGAFQRSDSNYAYQFRLFELAETDGPIVEIEKRSAKAPLAIAHDLYANCAPKMFGGTNGLIKPYPWRSKDQLQYHFESLLYSFTDEIESALKLARLAISEDSTSVKCLNNLANLHLVQGRQRKSRGESPLDDFNLSNKLLQKALALDGANSVTLGILSDLYIENEKWLKAEERLKKAHALTPLDPRIYLRLSRLHVSRYQSLGFSNEAELFRHAIQISPAYLTAFDGLARFYARKNRYDRACKTLIRALAINPNHVETLMLKASFHMAQKEMLEALEIYEKVLDLDPHNSDVYYNLGIFHYYDKNYNSALEAFENAIRIDDHLDSYLYLAYIHELQGDQEKAVEYLQARVRKRRNDDDRFAEEARKHLLRIMTERGVIDSVLAN